MNQSVVYNPSKTAILYHNDNESRFKLMFGHVGSGKSVANCIEVMRQFLRLPLCTDKVRRGKWVVVRNTYSQLKMTTVATWLQWFPERQFGKFYKDSPFLHQLRFTDEQGIQNELDVYFMSLNSQDDEDKLLSLEVTGFFVNEISELPWRIVEAMMTRLTCRYPSKKMLGLPEDYQDLPYHQCVIADTNPPPMRHWVKVRLEDAPDYERVGLKLYKQPPAMIYDIAKAKYVCNPERENRIGISDAAMEAMVVTLDEETFKVKVLGEYAAVFDGKPVHPAYKQSIHYCKHVITPVPNEPLYLGWDFGLTPAVVIMQYINSQVRVLDECYTFSMDLEQFLINLFLPKYYTKYAHWFNNSLYVSTGDPAGATPGQATGIHCLKILRHHGIETRAARTNKPLVRQSALNYHLNRMNMGEPGFIVSNNCVFINEGIAGGYRYDEIKSFEDGEIRYRDVPYKNEYSHTVEACHYGLMPLYSEAHHKKIEYEDVFDGLTWQRRFKAPTTPARI